MIRETGTSSSFNSLCPLIGYIWVIWHTFEIEFSFCIGVNNVMTYLGSIIA